MLVDYCGAHPVPVSGDGYVFDLFDVNTGCSFSVRVWGECGGLGNPYISIRTEYYYLSEGVGDIVVSYYTVLKEDHGCERNMFGGVSIWATFYLYMELGYVYINNEGIERCVVLTSRLRYGEFHCEHSRNIFE